MYLINKNGMFTEDSYDMNKEALSSTLFTTGNGYMGVRGSFEEFGQLRIQGAFVRGFIDEIVEVCEPFANNEYMKNYYLDEEKLKTFETQDSCVNMHDFLFVRVKIGDNVFYPWHSKIINFERTLDSKRGIYTRKVTFEDNEGNRTEIVFERFASFSNEHLYCQKVTVKKINHNLPVSIISGVDTYRKTGGQKITETDLIESIGTVIKHKFHATRKYGFSATYKIYNDFPNGKLKDYYENGVYGLECACDDSKTYVFEKITYIETSRDEISEEYNPITVSYEEELSKHVKEYKKLFSNCDITIKGDAEADGYLRYANYETIITQSFNDSVHGICAKGLTGERYNQFVWWDQEIHQLPFFIFSNPIQAKNALLYRYRMLEFSKKNAKELGFDGAKYAFCSSVEGDERVWQYARHPFLQIHINTDIPIGILNYYDWTHDIEFLMTKGLEMIYECLKYWKGRVTKTERGYELLNVTGTDEHHPYVNNDAYTNYSLKYVLERFLNLIKKYEYKIDEKTESELIEIKNNFYLPEAKNGLIPQFDGYFDLSRTLKSSGGASLKQFQMKTSGLYQYSQIIKQPDVLLLYTMMPFEMDEKYYPMNYDYYEKMCETSSSLTFPVHAIAAIDNGRILSFYEYFMNSLKIDIDDIHGVGHQGLHSGCMAGGYIEIIRGIFGLRAKEDYLLVKPNRMPLFKEVKGRIYYHSSLLEITQNSESIKIKVLNGEPVNVSYKDKMYTISNKKEFKL